jgi:hypothetical protein
MKITLSRTQWEQAGLQGKWLRPLTALEIVEAKKKGKAVNPWAVCTKSVGREDKDKYESCVMGVKEKHPIKKD